MSKKNQYKQERDASKIPYHKTPEGKNKVRVYQQSLEFKAYQKSYGQTPEAIAKRRARVQTLEYKAKQKAYQQTPEYKARRKAKRQTPEFKAKKKEYDKVYHQTPEAKAKRKERDKSYNKTLQGKLRRLVCNAFYRIKKNKPTNTLKLLGCDWETARAHFESLFKEGMSWENHGEWHIDHIRPVSSFTEEDMHLMNHISNLQPLWAHENSEKSDKIV